MRVEFVKFPTESVFDRNAFHLGIEVEFDNRNVFVDPLRRLMTKSATSSTPALSHLQASHS